VAVVPEPESEKEVGEFEALLTSETEPFAVPDAVGANLTFRVVLPPILIVRGADGELTEKPAPVTLIAETDALALPVLLSVIVKVFELPTATEPKLSELAESESVATGVGGAAPPAPVNAIEALAEEVVIAEILPVVAPAEDGANFTLAEKLAPALKVAGRAGAFTMEKPASLEVI